MCFLNDIGNPDYGLLHQRQLNGLHANHYRKLYSKRYQIFLRYHMIKIAWFSVVNWAMTYQDKYLENGVACIFY